MTDSKRKKSRKRRGKGHQLEQNDQTPNHKQEETPRDDSNDQKGEELVVDKISVDTANGLPSSRGNHQLGSRGNRRLMSSRGRGAHRGSQEMAKPGSMLPFRNEPGKTDSKPLSPSQVRDILEMSLSQITSPGTSRVDIVDNWAIESGLACIRQIVEADFSQSYSVTQLMFDPHVILFLRLISYISHDDIQNSLVLEKSVGTIYNVIYGPNGNRGVSFFRKVVDYLTRINVHEGEGNDSNNEAHYAEFLRHVTEAILSILLQVQEATFKSEFKEIANCLWESCFEKELDHILHSPATYLAGENILKIQNIFGIGDGITANKQSLQGNETHMERAIIIDPPGKLSKFGKRHDNDHAFITDIRILPTLSEILYSRRPDFLPSTESLYSQKGYHVKGIRLLLDSHFRLLREDTSGVLRDSVRVILEHWETLVHGIRWQDKRKLLRSHCPTPARIYYGAQIQKARSDRTKGMEIDVEFDQVLRARNMNCWKRKQHWLTTRGLNEGGALLALIDAEDKDDTSVVFFQVSQRHLEPVTDEKSKDTVRDLVSSGERATITLRLTNDPSNDDLDGIIHLLMNQSSSSARSFVLVEFPALFYNSFEGILRCLQRLYKDPRSLPFNDLIPPQDIYPKDIPTMSGQRVFHIGPPTYCQDWIVDFSPISIKQKDEGYVSLRYGLEDDISALCDGISFNTTLDKGQARAIAYAFRNRLALIQGPPGTGKSYVGIQIAKCLLSQNNSRDLGPILCVCYTNHALDQFLQGLYDSGIFSIVRIGSRSASPLLESLSLDNYKKLQKIPRIPGHGRFINGQRRKLDELAIDIGHVFKKLESGLDCVVGPYLQRRFPIQEREIVRGSVATDPEPLATWALGNGPGDPNGNGLGRRIEQLLAVDKWTLTKDERRRLLESWHKSAIEELTLQLQVLTQRHASEKQRLTSLYNQADAQIFDQVDVVGITTTGLANNAELLHNLNAKVLICEEAGEVLESHVLTTFLPSVEHAILIGDHLQLRPKISTKRLSAEFDSDEPSYNLDVSLFERLATFGLRRLNGSTGEHGYDIIHFPVTQLNVQRRMHPSIASLVRGTLYPSLCDQLQTHSYDDVFGFKHRLFWLDHRKNEDPDDPEDPMRSKTNAWEADMVISIVKHLYKQGQYKSGEIAILTPYIGQLRLLKDQLESIVDLVIGDQDLADLNESKESAKTHRTIGNVNQKGKLADSVRIATADNFQGDEATVVILSLVRSNKHRNCGFLKTSNRINVLLSRAKHGMYIVGNADTASSIPMWSAVIKILEDGGNIGPKLQLYCSRHPDSVAHVSSPEEFLVQAPEGGCSETCGQRLSCGHTCTFKCHSNRRHDAVQCIKQCVRMKECGHSCPLKCHEKCGECTTNIPNAHLPCGHVMDIECRYRGRLSSVKCEEVVVKKFPGCGHDVHVKCYEDISQKRCLQPCQEILECGHSCQRPCAVCWTLKANEIGEHAPCNTVCGNPYSTCSHTCTKPCHPSESCSPCDKPCEVRCRHNQCPKKCGEPCTPCAEKCEWSCIHRKNQVCNMPCAIPCDVVPCHRRCNRLLSCGHRCPSICGETCPGRNYCQICGNEDTLGRSVDLLTFDTYGSINLDEDPCVFLYCGHFYTMSSLDGVMDVKEYYNIDPVTDTITSPKWSRRVMSSISKFNGCPECRRPLREIYRYNRIVKKALLDESTKRFIVTASLELADLFDEVVKRKWEIENARAKQPLGFPGSEGEEEEEEEEEKPRVPHSERLTRPLNEKDDLQKRIDKFIKSVASVEQPYGRVNDLLASAASREDTVQSHVFRVDESQIQIGFQIRGQVLQLLLAWFKFWDYWLIAIDVQTDPELSYELRDVVANQVHGLLRDCESTRDSSRKAKLLAQEVKAMIYFGFFSSLALCVTEGNGQEDSAVTCQKLREQASAALEQCDILYSENPGTLSHLKKDIWLSKDLLSGTANFTFVSTEEKREVYNAMASQFQGSGHWYYCRNNHPFTVGECGMPMEEARCPECGAPVGGIDHTPSTGVTSADDFEERFGGE